MPETPIGRLLKWIMSLPLSATEKKQGFKIVEEIIDERRI